MKKFSLFLVSFILFQWVSGWVLTALYKPDFTLINSTGTQDTTVGNTSFIPFLVTLLTASFAYLLSDKLSMPSLR